jgi:hypothetical protein
MRLTARNGSLRPSARWATKKEPLGSIKSEWLPSPNLFQRSSRLLITLRALSLLISATVLHCPHVGLLGWRWSSWFNGSFFKGLTTSTCEVLLPTNLSAWSGSIPRGFYGFSLPYVLIISWGWPFVNPLFYFFSYGEKVGGVLSS